MITKVFSVFDSKAQAYGVPFFAVNEGLAVRSFTDLVNDSRSTVNRYPDDFILYHVGQFDDSDGKLVALKEPVSLGHASGYLKKVAVV